MLCTGVLVWLLNCSPLCHPAHAPSSNLTSGPGSTLAIRTFAKELSREIEEIHSGTARGHHARNAVKMYTYLVHVVAMAEESAANSATKHLGNAKVSQIEMNIGQGKE